MSTMPVLPLHTGKLTIAFLLIALLNSASAPANQNRILKQLMNYENDFDSIMFEYYRDSSQYSIDSQQTIPSIDLLYSEITWRIESNQAEIANQLIHYNIETIYNNLNRNIITKFIEFLLINQDRKLANKIFNRIKKNVSNKQIPTIQVIFAKYDALNNNWKSVKNRLTHNLHKINKEYSDYAYLLYGSSLMHTNNTPLAIENFKRIIPTSDYYPYAQLNIAIAKARSHSWNGVEDTLNNIILNPSNIWSHDEINRLYLLLGYTLLRGERYHAAIEAFKRISLKSQYTNRALIGIGLASIRHKSYDSGLSYLSLLKSNEIIDLSVDESYLLISYLYEKQQHDVAAAVSYETAINYYKKRLQELDIINQIKHNFSTANFDKTTSSMIIGHTRFVYNKYFPEAFMQNYKKLNILRVKAKNIKLKTKIEATLKKYNLALQKIVIYLVEQRKKQLSSYISQARYGLAIYYDNSQTR